MGVFKKGNRWVSDYYQDGKRKRKFHPTRRETERHLVIIREKKKPKRRGRAREAAALVREYLSTKEGTGQGNRLAVRRTLSKLLDAFPPGAKPQHLKPHHIEGFRISLRSYRVNTRIKWTCKPGASFTGHTNTASSTPPQMNSYHQYGYAPSPEPTPSTKPEPQP